MTYAHSPYTNARYGGEEFTPQLEELSRQVSSKGRRIKPDVRWSAFNAAQDKAVAEKVGWMCACAPLSSTT